MSKLDATEEWLDGVGVVGLLLGIVLLAPAIVVGSVMAVLVLAVAALAAIDAVGGLAVLAGVALLFAGAGLAGWLLLRRATSTADPDDPLEIARRRYARGEIGEAELERTLDRLLATDPDEGRADGRVEPVARAGAGERAAIEGSSRETRREPTRDRR
jgi:uncharacterized membrane protein